MISTIFITRAKRNQGKASEKSKKPKTITQETAIPGVVSAFQSPGFEKKRETACFLR
jgi:hypothetical protein